MIGTLDIGNSGIKGGLFDEGDLVSTFREPLADGPEPVAGRVADRLRAAGISRLGISSVVPEVSNAIESRVAAGGLMDVFRVRHTARLPFPIVYETPETLGVDRLAGVAGAWRICDLDAQPERSVIVVDAGTATTIDVLSDGRFVGGPILPGPELLRRAVESGTAQLPGADLEWPDRMIAGGTAEAVGTGIIVGFVDAVRGLLVRVVDELEGQPEVVATGGWSGLLAQKISLIGRRDPHLVLRGVDLLVRLNPLRMAG